MRTILSTIDSKEKVPVGKALDTLTQRQCQDETIVRRRYLRTARARAALVDTRHERQCTYIVSYIVLSASVSSCYFCRTRMLSTEVAIAQGDLLERYLLEN